MATDATGTPTTGDSIPTYNTAVDAPSGDGFNAAMAAIQTALTARIPKTLTTTTGDIIYASSANTPARLAIGSSSQVLTVAAGIPSWATPTTPDSTIYDRVVASTTNLNTTTETTMYTKSITGGDTGSNQLLRLSLFGTSKADSAGHAKNLTVRVKFGGSTISTLTYSPADSATTFPFIMTVNLQNLTASTQFMHATMTGFGATTQGYTTASVDTSTAQTLAVTMQWDLADATREVKVYSAVLEVL